MRLQAMPGMVHFGVISAALLAAVGLCEAINVVARIERPHAVFLPHGVVLVIAWMYGWMAVPLLFPAALLSAYLLMGTDILVPATLAVLAVRLVALPLTFDLFRRAGCDARGAGTQANWKMVVAAGLVGSLIGNAPRVVIGPCCGDLEGWDRASAFVDLVAADIAGTVLVLLAVMLFFRALRQG